jgi:hypothetical protein
MSTPEQPASPALTRKQLRDIRNTGATPIVSGDVPPVDETPVEDNSETATSETEESPVDSAPAPVAAPLPRAAQPVPVHDLPGADASVDLGVTPLTRRQARQQERIRTASVPVITPEVAAAHAAAAAAAAEHPDEADDVTDTSSGGVDLASLFATGPQPTQDDEHDAAETTEPTEPAEDTPAAEVDQPASAPDEGEPAAHADEHPSESADEPAGAPDHDDDAPATEADERPDADAAEPGPADERGPEPDNAERATVNPLFGAGLLAGEPAQVAVPPSFDQIISRSATGSVGTGNALILSQTPSAPPLVAPVTATGEVLITGTFNLPEGLGSTGHAPGTADGKDVDAVLVDGELPAHSSPTPIAASAAISTVKNAGDIIIKPPAPEKGGRLMLTLAITAGVLALALVGVLILAFVTGVF